MAEMLDFEEFKRRYQEVPVEEYPNRVREAVPDPLLTVHLITYNHADYIRKAIESVLMQEVDFPMEIVLGDDDSSDGTREICEEYAEQYPDLIRLQLHHRENNHRLYGRPTQLFQSWYNTLNARGKYIAVLSGDDYWSDSEKLHKQVSFLERNEEYSFSHHNSLVVDENGGVKEKKYFSEPYDEVMSKKDLIQAPLVVASSMVFLNVFQGVPAQFMNSIHEDRLITSTLGRYGKGRYYHDVKSAYRKGIGGLYEGSEVRSQYIDKKKYLEIISNVICRNNKCKSKIDNQRYYLDVQMCTELLDNGCYLQALKSNSNVIFKMLIRKELKNAAEHLIMITKKLL